MGTPLKRGFGSAGQQSCCGRLLSARAASRLPRRRPRWCRPAPWWRGAMYALVASPSLQICAARNANFHITTKYSRCTTTWHVACQRRGAFDAATERGPALEAVSHTHGGPTLRNVSLPTQRPSGSAGATKRHFDTDLACVPRRRPSEGPESPPRSSSRTRFRKFVSDSDHVSGASLGRLGTSRTVRSRVQRVDQRLPGVRGCCAR